MRTPRSSLTSPTIDLRLVLAAIVLAGAITAAPAPRLSASGTPAGWKAVKDRAGTCQISVPADWSAMAGFGLASDLTKKATAAIHTDKKNSWTQLKETAKSIFKPTSTIEDSASHLLFKYGASGLHYYAGRPFSGFNCVASVDVSDASAVDKLSEVAKKIIDSVDKSQ